MTEKERTNECHPKDEQETNIGQAKNDLNFEAIKQVTIYRVGECIRVTMYVCICVCTCVLLCVCVYIVRRGYLVICARSRIYTLCIYLCAFVCVSACACVCAMVGLRCTCTCVQSRPS